MQSGTRSEEFKWSTEGADDRTDDCASGADDVAGPGSKFKFLRFQMIVDKSPVGIAKSGLFAAALE